MIALLLAAAVATSGPAPSGFADIEGAITGGRFAQARIMIQRAMAGGAKGEPIDILLADLAYFEARDAEASARYAYLLPHHMHDTLMLERAALAAIRSGDRARGEALLKAASQSPRAGWRIWNAIGVLADRDRRFADADTAYAKALEVQPDQPAVLNNIGWSKLLRGDWAAAESDFDRAATLAPGSARIANNRDFARDALDQSLPDRQPGEDNDAYSARLNDAGVAAELRGDKARARAAYAEAIAVRGTWFDRADRNLDRVEGQR